MKWEVALRAGTVHGSPALPLQRTLQNRVPLKSATTLLSEQEPQEGLDAKTDCLTDGRLIVTPIL